MSSFVRGKRESRDPDDAAPPLKRGEMAENLFKKKRRTTTTTSTNTTMPLLDANEELPKPSKKDVKEVRVWFVFGLTSLIACFVVYR